MTRNTHFFNTIATALILVFICSSNENAAGQSAKPKGLSGESYNPNQVPLKGEITQVRESVYSCGRTYGYSQSGVITEVELIPLGASGTASLTGIKMDAVHLQTRMQQYDSEKRVVAEERRDRDGAPIHSLERLVSDDGLRAEYRSMDKNGNRITRVAETIDAQGRVISEDHYGVDGTPTLSITRTFDEQGRVDEETHITHDLTLDEKFRYIYSDDGLHVSEEHYTLDDRMTMSKMKHWNEQGYPLREQYYNDKRELTAQLIHEHDGRGRVVKTSFVTKAKGAEFYTIFRYGEGDYPTEVIQQSRKGLLHWRNFAYEFDETGNWTKRVMYNRILRNERPMYEPEEVIVREFTYSTGRSLDR